MIKRFVDLDEVIQTLQDNWLDGNPVSVEQLVEQNGLTDNSDAAVDLIYAEMLLREEQGESLDQQEYLDRFPQYRDLIVKQFQIHRALHTTPYGTDETAVGIPSPRLPGFELVEVVGRGGRGVVWKATDTKLDRTVAIKLLTELEADKQSTSAGLLREAESIASLVHRSIVKVHQVSEANGVSFLVMEYVDGGSLAARLQLGPLPIDEAVRIVTDVADAIEHAHQNGVIHRDIKPGNILLGSSGVPQICDFGLARRLSADQSLHVTGDVIGTPAYMPPEQAQGQRVDERADVYSLGAVLYESLTGRSPFQAATPWEILHQVIMNDPVPLRQLNPAIPKDLQTICERCLDKKTERRYQSAQEIVDELSRFRRGQPIKARPAGPVLKASKWFARNKRFGAALVLLALTFIIASVMTTWQWRSSQNNFLEAQVNLQEAENNFDAAIKLILDKLALAYEFRGTMGEERASVKLYDQLVNDVDTLAGMQVVLPKVIELRPRIYRLRAEIEWEVGNAEDAVKWFDKAEQRLAEYEEYCHRQSTSASVAPGQQESIIPLSRPDTSVVQLLRAEARHSVGQFHEAIEDYQYARSTLRKLVDLADETSPDKSPTKFYRNLALANVLEGHTWLELGQIEKAKTRYQTAYEMVPKVLAINPAGFLWDPALESELPRSKMLADAITSKKPHMLGFTSHFLGRFLVLTASQASDPNGQLQQGVYHLRQALKTRRELSQKSPRLTSFRRDIGLTLSELARAYIAMDRHDLALEHIDEAIEILSALKIASQRLEPHLRYAEALEIRGDLLVAANQPDQANAHYRQAIDHCETVLGISPSRWDCQRVLQQCRDKLTEAKVVSSDPSN